MKCYNSAGAITQGLQGDDLERQKSALTRANLYVNPALIEKMTPFVEAQKKVNLRIETEGEKSFSSNCWGSAGQARIEIVPDHVALWWGGDTSIIDIQYITDSCYNIEKITLTCVKCLNKTVEQSLELTLPKPLINLVEGYI